MSVKSPKSDGDVGNAQLCTAGGLRGLLDGLGEQRLQLRRSTG